jgi:hypothetical protein
LGEVLRGLLASGGFLILDENVAELAVAVSSAGKKKKLLFFLAETVRWTGWLCWWAGPLLVLCWANDMAAAVGLLLGFGQ